MQTTLDFKEPVQFGRLEVCCSERFNLGYSTLYNVYRTYHVYENCSEYAFRFSDVQTPFSRGC